MLKMVQEKIKVKAKHSIFLEKVKPTVVNESSLDIYTGVIWY